MDPSARDVEQKQALAVYAASLAIEARVAVFGDASLGIAERLLDAGALAVHVWDPDPERAIAQADRAPGGVYVEPFPPRDTELRLADVVVVPDLGLFDDPADVIARTYAMTAEGGVALVRAVNADAVSSEAARAFDYYELFELVARPFSVVRMVAELTFDGVAFVALGEQTDEAPAVSVDTQLADSDRRVAAFVAVASEREIPFDSYSIVELAPAETDTRIAPAPSEAQALADGLARELRDEAARRADLEAELAVRAERLSSFAAEVEALRTAVEVATVSSAEVQDLARRAGKAEEVAGRVEQAESRAAKLERDLATSDDAHATEVHRLEAALRERAQTVRSLEVELARREKIVRELVGSLAEAGGSVDPSSSAGTATLAVRVEPADADERHSVLAENARLKQQLDALALDLARREADAHASGWKIAELTRQLEQRMDAPPEGVAKAPDALSRALDEVDALRTALAQEHAARVRVESGAALAQARTDIERLTVLLEQYAAQRRGASPLGTDGGEPAAPDG